MSVLRGIEHRLESLFEGLFGRAFRSHVQPVEIARKLAKEMDDNRASSLSRTYAPNEYLLYLSPADRDQFRNYERALLQELSAYLAEHARKQGYALLSMPRVVVQEDADLALGQFGISTRMVQPARPHADPADSASSPAPPPAVSPRPAPIVEPPQPESRLDWGDPLDGRMEPALASADTGWTAPTRATAAWLELDGERHTLTGEVVVLGRSRESTVVVPDPGVSRTHCEIRRDGDVWVIVDTGSTNGIVVNGRRVARAALTSGDTITLGQTDVRFVSVDE